MRRSNPGGARERRLCAPLGIFWVTLDIILVRSWFSWRRPGAKTLCSSGYILGNTGYNPGQILVFLEAPRTVRIELMPGFFLSWGAHRNSHVNHTISKPTKKPGLLPGCLGLCVSIWCLKLLWDLSPQENPESGFDFHLTIFSDAFHELRIELGQWLPPLFLYR